MPSTQNAVNNREYRSVPIPHSTSRPAILASDLMPLSPKTLTTESGRSPRS
jgi:hypothetical protein